MPVQSSPVTPPGGLPSASLSSPGLGACAPKRLARRAKVNTSTSSTGVSGSPRRQPTRRSMLTLVQPLSVPTGSSTAVTVRNSHRSSSRRASPLARTWSGVRPKRRRASPTTTSESPGRSPSEVPCSHTSVSPNTGTAGLLVAPGMVFQAATACRSALVSNTCGSSPLPGIDWAAVAADTSTSVGAPGASSTSKASSTSADTPGRSSYPMVRASRRTDSRCVAVPRKPSCASRSV